MRSTSRPPVRALRCDVGSAASLGRLARRSVLLLEQRAAPGARSRSPRHGRPPLRTAEERRRGTRRTAPRPARRAGAAPGASSSACSAALRSARSFDGRGTCVSSRDPVLPRDRAPASIDANTASSASGLLRYGTKLVPKRRFTSSITTAVVGRHGREVGDDDPVEHRPHESVEGVPLEQPAAESLARLADDLRQHRVDAAGGSTTIVGHPVAHGEQDVGRRVHVVRRPRRRDSRTGTRAS